MQSATNNISEAFGLLVKSNDESIKQAFGDYRRGFLTDSDLKCAVRNAFDSYALFWSEQGIKRKISNKSWEGFLSDYQAWKSGKPLGDGGNRPWLVYSSYRFEGIHPTSDIEKDVFFKIMEICQFPVNYYEPMPEELPIPDMRITAYGSGNIWDIVDDGGLIGDPAPVGKTFILTDKYGLKTTVTIQQQGMDDRRDNCDYFGYGTIEGYTSNNPVKIDIDYRDNLVEYVRVRIDGYDIRHEHDEVFKSYPLWQEYFKRSNEKGAIYDACAEAFFEQRCKEEFGE